MLSKNYLCNSASAAAVMFALLAAPSPGFAQSAAGEQAEGAAPPANSSKATNPETIVEEVVVTGEGRIPGGLMKEQVASETMSSVTAAAIEEKLAAGSPLQLASTIPGVNFGSSDAYGLSIRNFMSIRGLDQTEMGFMIENIPGIDLTSYYPYAETWADNENISDITVTPGNSRLQDPIINASGGEFIETIRTPRDTFGGMASGSVGSNDGWRTFVDIDTGRIGNSGAKAFLSYSHTSASNFVGPGTNTRDHIDFKVVEDWSPKAHSSLFASYNYWVNARLPPLNLAQAQNAFATNNLEQYQYGASYTPGINNSYYKLLQSYRTNYLVASNNDFELTDRVTLHITPYYRYNYSISLGEAAFSPTSIFAGNQKVTPAYPSYSLQNGKIFLASDLDFVEHQAGVNSYVEANITPDNLFMIGYWHENFHENEINVYNPLNGNGEPSGHQEYTALYSTGGALVTGTDWSADTTTDQIFVGDTQTMLGDKLQLSVGFKNLFYSAQGVNRVIGAPPSFSANWSEPMPRFLASYDIDDHNQVYANVTTNARMPNVAGTYVTTFSTGTGGVTLSGNPATKPEYTVGEQIGYRYHGLLNVDAAAFYMNLANHQVSSGQLINGTIVNTSISAGGETIRGASLELSTRTYEGFSFYGNAQYLYGTFDGNVPVNGDYLPTKGNQMVQSPNWVSSVGGRYEKGPFFAEVTAKYVGPQFTTFMDNQTMPSYETVDLALGYHLPEVEGLKEPVLRLNLTNLGNKSYISSAASATSTAVAMRGINGRPIAASQPLYYVAAPLAVMATLSTKF